MYTLQYTLHSSICEDTHENHGQLKKEYVIDCNETPCYPSYYTVISLIKVVDKVYLRISKFRHRLGLTIANIYIDQ